jgi:hypothetical protein
MENEMDGIRDTFMGENTSARRVVMGRTEAKKPLVQDFGGGGEWKGTKMHTKETGCVDVAWIHLIQERDRRENGNETSDCINCEDILD